MQPYWPIECQVDNERLPVISNLSRQEKRELMEQMPEDVLRFLRIMNENWDVVEVSYERKG